MMKIEMPPLESCAGIGGFDAQIQENKQAVELPELYEGIGFRPPKGVILYGEHGNLYLRRAKTPEERAHVDLETHYTKEYLDEKLESCTRRAIRYLPEDVLVVLLSMLGFRVKTLIHSWVYSSDA